MLWHQVLPALTTGVVLLAAVLGAWWSAIRIMHSAIDSRVAEPIHKAERRIIEKVDDKLSDHRAEWKQDFREFRAEWKQDFADFRDEIRDGMQEMREESRQTRKDMHEMRADMRDMRKDMRKIQALVVEHIIDH